MTTHKDQRIRLATVELLGVLLRQGQLNPMDAVKYLFAMQGDVQAPSVRALSLRLLIAEKENRAEMMRQRGLAGVKQAYRLQRAVYSSTLEPTAVIKRKRGKTEEVVSVFDSAFKECVRDAKKHMMGLYRSLLGLFASDMFDEEQFCLTSKKMAAKQKKDLSLLSFIAQAVAHLPYNVASDPLFIIHHISGMTAMQGAQLLDRLSSFLRPCLLTTADELDNNASEDILEKAAKKKSPSRKKEISRINGADFDLEKFSNLLAEACAMVLLLRLKAFLCYHYQVSELRCLQYLPDAKERIREKELNVFIKIPFNASIEMATTAKRSSKCHDMDVLIRLYVEFRILMRAEQSSTASSDSEETTPPSSSKKREEQVSLSIISARCIRLLVDIGLMVTVVYTILAVSCGATYVTRGKITGLGEILRRGYLSHSIEIDGNRFMEETRCSTLTNFCSYSYCTVLRLPPRHQIIKSMSK